MILRTAVAILLVSHCPRSAAADRPDWAFFVPASGTAPVTVMGINPQMQDPLNPPDWYPAEHPVMPDIVAHGYSRPGAGPILPCALCHLPNGAGHVESAPLAGLTATYIVHQLKDIRSGDRQITVGNAHTKELILGLKKSLTDQQIQAAARYFSTLKPIPWIRVVESNIAPASAVNPDNLMRLPTPDGGIEPLGSRIVELPVSAAGLVNRDDHSGFVAYVPKGSITAGEALVVRGGPGRTLACSNCHGSRLTGLGDIPPLAGRPPSYVARQLWAFQTGIRAGSAAAAMKPVVVNLTADEMLNIAAYLASQPPR